MDLQDLKERIRPVLLEHGVVRASVFGSMARGEATEESDIDLLVELEEGSSLMDLAGLKVDLEDILGRTVDVVTYDSIHPSLREQILKEQRAII